MQAKSVIFLRVRFVDPNQQTNHSIERGFKKCQHDGMWTPSAVMGQDWFQHHGTNAIELRTFMAKRPASTASCTLCCKKSIILCCGPLLLDNSATAWLSCGHGFTSWVTKFAKPCKTWCSNSVQIPPGHRGARPVHPLVEVQGVKLLLRRWRDVFDNRPHIDRSFRRGRLSEVCTVHFNADHLGRSQVFLRVPGLQETPHHRGQCDGVCDHLKGEGQWLHRQPAGRKVGRRWNQPDFGTKSRCHENNCKTPRECSYIKSIQISSEYPKLMLCYQI